MSKNENIKSCSARQGKMQFFSFTLPAVLCSARGGINQRECLIGCCTSKRTDSLLHAALWNIRLARVDRSETWTSSQPEARLAAAADGWFIMQNYSYLLTTKSRALKLMSYVLENVALPKPAWSCVVVFCLEFRSALSPARRTCSLSQRAATKKYFLVQTSLDQCFREHQQVKTWKLEFAD